MAARLAVLIDAMDLLYAGNVEGFVIVSSDSDFTRLATRLRESAMTVYGVGRRNTPEPFRKACDRFIYLELLGPKPEPEQPSGLEGLLRAAITGTGKVNGWSSLAEVGSYLSARKPDFDARDYGAAKLGELVRAQDYVEVDEVREANGLSQLRVRLKARSTRSR